jgi:hypothetical protein
MKTTAPTPHILVEGIHNNPEFLERVRARVAEAVGRVVPPPTGAKIIFADENGPKGGVAIRCTIVHDMPKRRDFTEIGHGNTFEVAFDDAFAALETSIARDRGRRRESVRRPKKYYLAKRLLSPDETLSPPELPAEAPDGAASPRAKRVRRRRVA